MTYAGLMEQIREHPRYGPAMQKASDGDLQLVLNYHSHQGDGRYCVSVCARTGSLLEHWLDMGPAEFEELVHVEGFGQGAENCIPLCSSLAKELRRQYGFSKTPLIYLDGKPIQGTAGQGTPGAPPGGGS